MPFVPMLTCKDCQGTHRFRALYTQMDTNADSGRARGLVYATLGVCKADTFMHMQMACTDSCGQLVQMTKLI